MDVLLVAGVPAAVWATLIGLLARGRNRPVAGWAGVTFVAALLMGLAAIAVPSLNPGTGRAVVGTVMISGMVWCLLAPVFILRPQRGQQERPQNAPEPLAV